jgi:release factor glutamine methyltransferase
MVKSRKLSVYEKNQLLKYSLKEADLFTKGELPVEYLTGFVNFAELELKVNQNVLIPRVETEELLDLMTAHALSLKEPISYLEIGTGSGAISLAFFNFLLKQNQILLKEFFSTDVSNKALILAKENFSRLFKEEFLTKVNFLESNLLEKVINQKFNLIVANLPYIPSNKINGLDQSVKDYEPILALDGGETGFELINNMLLQILNKNLLAKNAKVFLEVYEDHNLEFIKEKFPKIYEEFSIEEFKDQFERQRFLVLQKI